MEILSLVRGKDLGSGRGLFEVLRFE